MRERSWCHRTGNTRARCDATAFGPSVGEPARRLGAGQAGRCHAKATQHLVGGHRQAAFPF
jgi:hypothetical protein